jgi:hypothetical protein
MIMINNHPLNLNPCESSSRAVLLKRKKKVTFIYVAWLRRAVHPRNTITKEEGQRSWKRRILSRYEDCGRRRECRVGFLRDGDLQPEIYISWFNFPLANARADTHTTGGGTWWSCWVVIWVGTNGEKASIFSLHWAWARSSRSKKSKFTTTKAQTGVTEGLPAHVPLGRETGCISHDGLV